ncbi:hypothetical protein BFP70_09855 [Thioclava sp. SK-1]|uniref:sigma-70 family RNA polymerase sigma factor n=1 Tax=Thioclava sp. SK-1 TaxID=1889770 RepID=UPI000825B9A9|nr:sigma-70 family RNA polymerase sigma factor [Thioclava sp. SK-1]OCX65360.1 hypothetical protein BFP70_09855 [Thioclava sp. SK-1]
MTQTECLWAGWMHAALDGDGQAYARLLDALVPVLRGIIRARARDIRPDDQEDLVQEVLIAIHTKRATWDRDRPLRPWIYAIARHKVIDGFRKRNLTTEDIADWSESLPDEAQLSQARGREAAQDLDVILADIDPVSAEMIRAIKLREEDPGEVALRMGIAEGTLRVRLHRTLKKLEELGRRMDR